MMLPDRGYAIGTESAVGKGLRQADSIWVCALCSGVCVKAVSASKMPLIVSYSLIQGQLLGEQSHVPPLDAHIDSKTHHGNVNIVEIMLLERPF